jgi:hypothetical protein
MFGENHRLKALASRKLLLIAESDLNRAQLIQAWQTMAVEVHALANRAKTITSIASAAALLAAGLSAFRRKKSGSAGEKTSWWRTIVKVAGLASAVWPAFRNRPKP